MWWQWFRKGGGAWIGGGWTHLQKHVCVRVCVSVCLFVQVSADARTGLMLARGI